MDKELQEIETKIMGILSVKKCKEKLTKEEEHSFDMFNKKYRDGQGKLINGSFFINSDSKWQEVI